MFDGIISWFSDPSNYQQIQTLLMASGFGLAFFVAKGITVLKAPVAFILKQFYSYNQLTDATWEQRGNFHAYMKFIQDQKLYFRRSVTPTANQNRSDTINSRMVTPGAGWFIMYWERRFFLVRTEYDRREFGLSVYTTIYKFGPKTNVFSRMTETALGVSKNRLAVYRLSEDGRWGLSSMIYKRKPETVITTGDTTNEICESFKKFFTREEECISRGAIWKHVVLLYGPPGTGKSSIAKVVASEFDFDIYMADTKRVKDDNFIDAIGKIPPEGMLLLEDIDSNKAFHDRKNFGYGEEATEFDENGRPKVPGLSLDGFLNTMDGVLTPHGLKVMMSTNHIDKLDEAVVRPGRVNLRKCISFVGAEELMKFIQFRYPGNQYRVKSGIPLQPSLVGETADNYPDSVDLFVAALNRVVGYAVYEKIDCRESHSETYSKINQR